MNEAIKNFADSYLAVHPMAARWHTLDSSAQQGALALAAEDIAAYLGGSASNLTNRLQMAAVCEQALYLIREAAKPDSEIVSETVEGLGTRTYRNSTESKSFISGRALALLEPQLRRHLGKISRG